MRESLIFPTKQLAELKRRMRGEMKDTKNWYQVKLKLFELMELFKIKNKLEKLLEYRGDHKVRKWGGK